MKKLFVVLAIAVLGLQQLTVLPGCANIIPPAGGPRDSIAPVLLKATPGDSTRKFSGNKITLTFDEYVEVQNVTENLLVSPLPKILPGITSRLNTVTIKISDTLEENTTYTLQFGNAIKDFNEGNVLKGFSFVFSTGPYIDSLECSGQVLLAENGRVDSTLLVLLHTSADDSAVVKEKPRYITRLDGEGKFRFRNLPPKTFYLYALKDEGGTRRYYDDKQLFAFADSAIQVTGNLKPVTLYAYSSKPPQPDAPKPAAGPGIRPRGVAGGGSDKRLRYQTSLLNNQQDLLNPLTLTFDNPLRNYDSNGLKLYRDTLYTPVPEARFKLDSTREKIALTLDWKENTAYQLVLSKTMADDSTGRTLLKDDTLKFQTRKLSDYGSLKIRFRNLDLNSHPVLLFLSGETIVRSVPLTGPEYIVPQMLPAEYDLRILFDRNQNGAWDPGKFFGEHRQPEIVKPIARKISVKPNWQNEFDIDAPAAPPEKK